MFPKIAFWKIYFACWSNYTVDRTPQASSTITTTQGTTSFTLFIWCHSHLNTHSSVHLVICTHSKNGIQMEILSTSSNHEPDTTTTILIIIKTLNDLGFLLDCYFSSRKIHLILYWNSLNTSCFFIKAFTRKIRREQDFVQCLLSQKALYIK